MATAYTVTHDFNTGDLIVADQVDTNFSDILTAINALDAANLASGTVALARISGLTSTQMASAFFKDEDSFTSAAATNVYSGESIKAYADTKEAALVTQATASIFGSWTNLDSSSDVLAVTEVYKVGSDGLIIGFGTTANATITVDTDGSNPPTTKRYGNRDYASGSMSGFCVPVRKDDYWQVNASAGAATIYWLPIGTGTCVKQ